MTAPRPEASIEPAATPLSSLRRPRNTSSGVASLLRSSHPLLRRISISRASISSPPTRWNGGGRCQLTLSRGVLLARVDCPRGEQLQSTAAPYIGAITPVFITTIPIWNEMPRLGGRSASPGPAGLLRASDIHSHEVSE